MAIFPCRPLQSGRHLYRHLPGIITYHSEGHFPCPPAPAPRKPHRPSTPVTGGVTQWCPLCPCKALTSTQTLGSCLIPSTFSRKIFLLEDPRGGSPGLALLLGSPSVGDEGCVLTAGSGQQAAVQGLLPAESSCGNRGSSSLVSCGVNRKPDRVKTVASRCEKARHSLMRT